MFSAVLVLPEQRLRQNIEALEKNIAAAEEKPLMWRLSWRHCQAVPVSWHGLAVVLWRKMPGFRATMDIQLCKVWNGLPVSSRTAPLKGAKLCATCGWFLRPGLVWLPGMDRFPSCYAPDSCGLCRV